MPCNCAKCSGGLGAYNAEPPLAQTGFRLGIPGGPRGGQYHGRVTANATNLHYHGRRARALSGDQSGPPFDPFHRAPGEIVPRPNAAGDLNVVTVGHGRHVLNSSMVPGGFFPVSRLGALPIVNPPGWNPARAQPIAIHSFPPVNGGPVRSPIPSWAGWGSTTPAPGTPPAAPGPGGTCPVGATLDSAGMCWPNSLPYGTDWGSGAFGPVICPGPACPVPASGGWQPPNVAPVPLMPSPTAAPVPVTGNPCPPGQYQDSIGNCTDDWHNPYPVYTPAQPSPTVPASTAGTPTAGQPGCVSGMYDVSGNCITSTVPGTTPSWFTDPTQEIITGIPNWILAAGAAGGLLLLMRGRR